MAISEEEEEQPVEQLKSTIEIDQKRSDHVAIWLTDTFGSLTFLSICLATLIVYFLWNTNLIPGLRPFDLYPFSALDMVLSVFAVMLSISVLISQNRQRRMEKIRELVEFEVNIRAENEITKILEMLHEIQQKIGINKQDPELEKMKESLDIQQLHDQAGKES